MNGGLNNQVQFWAAPTKKETQEIAATPPARNGTLAKEWLGGVHPDGQLEVTSGFYLHAGKFSRVLAFLAHERQPEGSVYDQLKEATGMSRTQVKAFVQYGVHMELLVPRTLHLNPLCRIIFHYDPFFDQSGTLWLLHYMFASNPLLVVWNYMCNTVLPTVAKISKAEAAGRFLPFIGQWSESSIRKNVRKELRAFFADYALEMFLPLDYLCEVEDNIYTVNRDVAPVPPLVLLAALLVYRDRHQPGSTGVEIPTLVYADHSPGRILRQGELYIRQALNRLHEAGWLSIEAKADLDQVRFKAGQTWLDVMQAYYEER